MNAQTSLFDINYAKSRQAIAWNSVPKETTDTQIEIVKNYLNANPLKSVSELCLALGFEKNVMSRVLATRINGKRVFSVEKEKKCPIQNKNVTAWQNQ